MEAKTATLVSQEDWRRESAKFVTWEVYEPHQVAVNSALHYLTDQCHQWETEAWGEGNLGPCDGEEGAAQPYFRRSGEVSYSNVSQQPCQLENGAAVSLPEIPTVPQPLFASDRPAHEREKSVVSVSSSKGRGRHPPLLLKVLRRGP